ncbi:MAG: hypothetical protein LAP13_15255, partial [Acidobacteriia bacterium]|nr:hypothetical protein [Terriglobia bacterium]
MTDERSKPLSVRDRLAVTFILATVAGLTLADVLGDWTSGGSTAHIGVELLVAGAAADRAAPATGRPQHAPPRVSGESQKSDGAGGRGGPRAIP